MEHAREQKERIDSRTTVRRIERNMGKRLFVGNLPYSSTPDELRTLFGQCGNVTDVHIVMDRETNRPRGFAFVSFATDEEAAKAVQQLAGKDIGGRPLVVNEARDRGEPGPVGTRPPRPSGPRPDGAGGRPGGYAGSRPSGAGGGFGGPRPSGGGFGGPRPGGGGGGGFGGARPTPGGFGGSEIPEETTRRRPPQKKKPEPERDRVPKVRPREEEDDLAVGSWRQWIEEDDDDTKLFEDDIKIHDEDEKLSDDDAADKDKKSSQSDGADA